MASLFIAVLLCASTSFAQSSIDSNNYELILRDSTGEPDLSLEADIFIQELNVISAGEGELRLHGADTLFQVDRENLPQHPNDGSTHKNVRLHLKIETSVEELLRVLEDEEQKPAQPTTDQED